MADPKSIADIARMIGPFRTSVAVLFAFVVLLAAYTLGFGILFGVVWVWAGLLFGITVPVAKLSAAFAMASTLLSLWKVRK